MSSIFLSHTHADKPFVRRLARDLKAAGVHVWIDEAEIMIGDSLIEKIRHGIDEMEYVGVVLSPNSVNSSWVQREVDVAMNQEIVGKRVKVLPLVINDCELPGFLTGKLYADFRDSERYGEELDNVLRRLTSDSNPEPLTESLPPQADTSTIFRNLMRACRYALREIEDIHSFPVRFEVAFSGNDMQDFEDLLDTWLDIEGIRDKYKVKNIRQCFQELRTRKTKEGWSEDFREDAANVVREWKGYFADRLSSKG